MRYLWNNSVDLIAGGAVLIAFALVCAFLAHVGLGLIFHIAYLGSITLGGIFFVCGVVIFCLRFAVQSGPGKVILVALFAQFFLLIPLFVLQTQGKFHLHRYGPQIELIVSGVWVLSAQMASLLLLIGLIRRFFYNRPQP